MLEILPYISHREYLPCLVEVACLEAVPYQVEEACLGEVPYQEVVVPYQEEVGPCLEVPYLGVVPFQVVVEVRNLDQMVVYQMEVWVEVLSCQEVVLSFPAVEDQVVDQEDLDIHLALGTLEVGLVVQMEVVCKNVQKTEHDIQEYR